MFDFCKIMADSKNLQSENLQSRPPVVVVLGHVDHGKTSILDYVRHTKVAEKEAGGITQHVGAYQVGHNGKFITFIDTPGHEAFSAIRSRGAKVADIAVLVVAADEGVKPQAKEAINYILRLNLPVVVAINKMDKPAALPDKVKKELAENKILTESMGGKVPAVLVSAKTGLNINELLEMILLVAEIEGIKGDYSAPASGVVIESRIDPQRGPTATLLVKEGTLTNQDVVGAESAYASIKTMEDFQGRPINQAGPSTPIVVTGFNQVPPVGEEWQVASSLEAARQKVGVKAELEKKKREPAGVLETDGGKKMYNIVVKADVLGSLEAVREALKVIPQEEVMIRIIRAEVGDISENDVKLVSSAKAKIYGFRVKVGADVLSLAKREKAGIVVAEIIYELVQQIREGAAGVLAPRLLRQEIGKIKVLEIFKNDKRGQIVGGRVTEGKVEKNAKLEIEREEEIIGRGRIGQLQYNKENVSQVAKDKECGLLIEADAVIDRGDFLKIYQETVKRREL